MSCLGSSGLYFVPPNSTMIGPRGFGEGENARFSWKMVLLHTEPFIKNSKISMLGWPGKSPYLKLFMKMWIIMKD